MIAIPESALEPRTRRLMLSKITMAPEFDDWVQPYVTPTMSLNALIDLLLPHRVPFDIDRQPPEDWLADNVSGPWTLWLTGMHFQQADDAFAFKMRWI